MSSSTTVSHVWQMRCPQCGDDSRIDIRAKVYVRLCRDGTDLTAPRNGDHEWDSSDTAQCDACSYVGTVTDFSLVESGPEVPPFLQALQHVIERGDALIVAVDGTTEHIDDESEDLAALDRLERFAALIDSVLLWSRALVEWIETHEVDDDIALLELRKRSVPNDSNEEG